MAQRGWLIDLGRCIGCHSCTVACKSEQNTAPANSPLLFKGGNIQGLLMGPSTLEVKQLYHEAGADISENFKDLPDHVGLELACMQFLCEAEARAWEADHHEEIRRVRSFQKRLLDEHLLQWVPALCGRILERAPGPFYRGIASLTEAYLEKEADALAPSTGV